MTITDIARPEARFHTLARRGLLVGASLLIGGGSAPILPPPNQDAELIRLCAAFLAHDRAANEAYFAADRDDRTKAEQHTAWEAAQTATREGHAMLRRIADIPARTEAGKLAKVGIVRAWLGSNEDAPELPPYASPYDRVAWSLTSDLMGRA